MDPRGLLEGLASEASEILNRVVEPHGLHARARPAIKGGWLVYARSRDFMQLGWSLKRSTAEDIQLLVKPGGAAAHGPLLAVEAWFRPRAQRAALWRQSGAAPVGFHFDSGWRMWGRQAQVNLSGDVRSIQASILKTWKVAALALDERGAFDHV